MQLLPTERECLALVWAVNKFQSSMQSVHPVRTDRNPLACLRKIKQPSGHLPQCMMILKEYQYKAEYRPGKLLDNADFMSRVGKEEEAESILQTRSQGTQTDEQSLNNRAEKEICSNEVEKVPTLRVAANGRKDILAIEEKLLQASKSDREQEQVQDENVKTEHDMNKKSKCKSQVDMVNNQTVTELRRGRHN